MLSRILDGNNCIKRSLLNIYKFYKELSKHGDYLTIKIIRWKGIKKASRRRLKNLFFLRLDTYRIKS